MTMQDTEIQYAQYDAFLPQITQYIPNVPIFLAQEAIKNAVIDFCDRTRYWQYDSFIPVGQNQQKYTLGIPDGTKILDVMQVYYDQSLLIPLSQDQLANVFRLSDWDTLTGQPQYYTKLNQNDILIVPYVIFPFGNGSTVHFRVTLTPLRSATQVISDVYEYWAEVIGYGARARLHMEQKQPYYDVGLATEAMRRFKFMINEVKIHVNKGFTRTSPQNEFQRWV